MPDNCLSAIHPGEFLGEILGEMDISQAEFARAIGIAPLRVSQVIHGTRPITAELALLFGRAFDQSPRYWLNLQAAYDLTTVEANISGRLAQVRRFAPMAIDVKQRHMP
jgi:antitoxin HigA-1